VEEASNSKQAAHEASTAENQSLVRLAEAKRNAETAEAKLAAFKKQQKAARDGGKNSKSLAALNSQLGATKQGIRRAQQDKAYIESLLAQQLALWNSAHTSTQAANGDGRTSALDVPEIRQLRLQIRQYEDEIARARREESRLESDIEAERSGAASAEADGQSQRLTRDFESAQKTYQDLLASSEASQKTSQAQDQSKGQEIALALPATLPTSAASPHRSLFAFSGLVIGLLISMAFALWDDDGARRISTEADAVSAFGAPVLISVPWVGTAAGNDNGNEFNNRNGKPEQKANETIPV
jgi:uncharacterized protein involved in exopolysaccharide biosynthesis